MKYTSLLLVLALLFFGCKPGKNEGKQKDTDKEWKTYQLTRTDGSVVDPQSLEGKVVFVNFWATWCKPCIEEMPSLQRMVEKFQGKEIEFLFASDEDMERIVSFAKKKEMNLPFVQIGNLSDLTVQVLPTTYIFDRSGKKVFDEVGGRDWDSEENVKMISDILGQ